MNKQLLFDCPQPVEESLAAGLLQIRAVEIRPHEPFTWSSGWKSPMYCDNRLILGYPVLRSVVINGFQSIVEKDFPGVDLIAGAATGGIAHAALLADRLGLPAAYVRGSAKDHGKQKRVEGRIVPGAKAIVIEDTLSTGSSAYSAALALQQEGVGVLAVCAIFSYDFDVLKDTAASSYIPAYRLLNFDTLIQVALKQGYITQPDVDVLLQWREQPDQFA